MMVDKVFGEPLYFKLVDNIPISKTLYYPIITSDSHLLIYKQADLVDPNVVPLCRFYYAGIQKFLMYDDEYCVYDVDKRLLEERSRILHESDKITNYKQIQWWLGKCPANYYFENPKKHNSVLMSALCKIEDGMEEYQRVCVYKCKCR